MKTKKHLPMLILISWLAAGIYALTGCGVYTEITTTSDNTADFSKYKSFAWLPDQYDTTNSPYNNEIIRNNLKNYFGQSFTERGFIVNLDTPDVLLQIVVANKKREREVINPPRHMHYYYCPYYYCSRYYSPYPYDYYYHHYPTYCYAMGYCKETVRYVEGSITLNVVDRKQSKLIWSGTARGDIYDPSYIDEDIHPAVLRIMKNFPVLPIEKKKKNTNADDMFLMNTKPVSQK